MSRVQLALRVSDLEGSVAFYSKLFGVEPAKRRPGYANFAIEQPPLKLVLLEGAPDQPTVMDHLGVEVFDGAEVAAATERLTQSGLITLTENDTSCCYAVQDKVWVRGPGNEPWEVYVVKGDSDQYGKSADAQPGADGNCKCGEAGDTGDGKEDEATATVGAASGGCCS
ncbi:glyoxalase/bleomycin resistance/dioxygenase family protein [Plantactinospora sp. BC1]|uniref:ArsI/CadI family heavy metal resistance metalloenzyme n=1 Tax=Plantactinospora sp. BC1 TaxID=2108470 RepID=UPI000D162BE4|nr:ArsI/CadI family heavy metal resistance metalloenzyme [Plantactinospora sp. BC1]AVT32457.1 glyoxalase/bleomycin resistance/dioxygenase family protein [Plantactinospora sp. BC1]